MFAVMPSTDFTVSTTSHHEATHPKTKQVEEHLPLPKQYPPVGFKNWGNTCYANASLQCLFSTALSRALLEPKCFRIFKRYASNVHLLENGVGCVNPLTNHDEERENPEDSCSYLSDDNRSEGSGTRRRRKHTETRHHHRKLEETCEWLTEELTTLCRKYTANPQDNSSILYKFGLSSSSQIIDPGNITRHVTRLSECLTVGRQEDAHEFLRALISTLVMDGHNKQLSALFDGLLESAVTCQTCGHCSMTRDRYMDLSLEISDENVHSLDEALQMFTKMEMLSKDNMVDCDKCETKRVVSKGLRLATAPTILVFHLKRFMQDPYGRISRLSKAVQFPTSLEIGDYMSKANRSVPPPYELVSVLVHQGNNCSSGHYLSYVKSVDNWYRVSDSNVDQVSIEHVLSQKAYILMYEVKGMRNHKIKLKQTLESQPQHMRQNSYNDLTQFATTASNSWRGNDTNYRQQPQQDSCSLFSFFDLMTLTCGVDGCFGSIFKESNRVTHDRSASSKSWKIVKSPASLSITCPKSLSKKQSRPETKRDEAVNTEISNHKRCSSSANLIDACKQAETAYRPTDKEKGRGRSSGTDASHTGTKTRHRRRRTFTMTTTSSTTTTYICNASDIGFVPWKKVDSQQFRSTPIKLTSHRSIGSRSRRSRVRRNPKSTKRSEDALEDTSPCSLPNQRSGYSGNLPPLPPPRRAKSTN